MKSHHACGECGNYNDRDVLFKSGQSTQTQVVKSTQVQKVEKKKSADQGAAATEKAAKAASQA